MPLAVDAIGKHGASSKSINFFPGFFGAQCYFFFGKTNGCIKECNANVLWFQDKMQKDKIKPKASRW